MADIELVIKIPEELKNKIDNANEDNYSFYIRWFETTLYCAIKNGTSLPEGHGRLIDADALDEAKEMVDTFGGGCKYAVRMDNIRLIPSVIKADKAESEG